jgi:hypothetical protein
LGIAIQKDQSILTIIDMYNNHIGSADIAVQLRSYHDTDLHHSKIWKPLFHYALLRAICNAYKLFEGSGYGDTKHSGYVTFRKRLATSLMTRDIFVPPVSLPIDPSLSTEMPYSGICEDTDPLSNPLEVINPQIEYVD